jgi:hypothetical protein
VAEGIEGYARHAERYGTAEVYETAKAELETLDLGRLCLRLRHIDSRWKLSQTEVRWLAAALLKEQLSDKRTAAMATCSVRTVRRIREELELELKRVAWVKESKALDQLVNLADCARKPALQSGEKWTIRPWQGNGSDAAIGKEEAVQ